MDCYWLRFIACVLLLGHAGLLNPVGAQVEYPMGMWLRLSIQTDREEISGKK